MKWHTISLADVPATPWKNGGGITRELLAWPSAADWSLRLSVAEVAASGPFSVFDGTERWFAVLRGAGVRLDVDGVATALGLSTPPFRFEGEARTHCDLIDGPTTDFNLMLRACNGQMQRLNGETRLQVDTPFFIALYAMNTRTEVVFDSRTWLLEPQTLLWGMAEPGDAQVKLQVSTESALWMEVRP